MRCCMMVYQFKQWWALMYHDRNTYIKNQACEYCGEHLRMFEKIIFPLNCINN